MPDYMVSDQGRFKSKNKILKTSKRNSYTSIRLRKNKIPKTYYAHRVVAEAFCKKPSAAHSQVHHINGCHSDNRASNLQWVTPSENSQLHQGQNSKGWKKKKEITLVSFLWIDSDTSRGWEDDIDDICEYCYTSAILIAEKQNSIAVSTTTGHYGSHLSPVWVPYAAIKGGKKGIEKKTIRIDRSV